MFSLKKNISLRLLLAFTTIGGLGCPLPSHAQIPTQGLVTHISFDGDDFTTHADDQFQTRLFRDSSGTNAHADCQSAWSANSLVFNQCPSQSIGPDGSKAAQFESLGLCDRASDYLSIPKLPTLAAMTQGSFAFFEYRNSAANFNHEVLDTYKLYVPRTYKLHRDGDSYLTFTANTNGGRETDIFTFPTGAPNFGRWNHYALTWDGTSFKGYFNGVYFGDAPMQWISSLDIQHYLAVGAMMHGELRNTPDGDNCVRQYGAPAGSYVFPNAGFMTGRIDDLRIYNRPLTPQEISALAAQNLSPQQEYILSVKRAGNGFGVVGTVDINGTSVPGIGCGKHCAETFARNTTPSNAQRVFLKATPYEGSTFSGWSGGCTGTGVCEVPLTHHFSVTANFTKAFVEVASFEAEEGQILPPFEVSEGAITQRQNTGSNILLAGKASYSFTITERGEYIVAAVVNVPSQSANSFYLTIGDSQVEPTLDNVWHISTTGGFDERLVSWGGYASGGNPYKSFILEPGNYTLVVRAREPATSIDRLSILKKGAAIAPNSPTNLRISEG